jgi:hypothetical protein
MSIIPDITGSFLSRDPDYIDEILSWFSSLPPGEYPLTLPPDYIPILQSLYWPRMMHRR